MPASSKSTQTLKCGVTQPRKNNGRFKGRNRRRKKKVSSAPVAKEAIERAKDFFFGTNIPRDRWLCFTESTLSRKDTIAGVSDTPQSTVDQHVKCLLRSKQVICRITNEKQEFLHRAPQHLRFGRTNQRYLQISEKREPISTVYDDIFKDSARGVSAAESGHMQNENTDETPQHDQLGSNDGRSLLQTRGQVELGATLGQTKANVPPGRQDSCEL